eukprot:8329690-Pyramimonas_sp.AAC.1
MHWEFECLLRPFGVIGIAGSCGGSPTGPLLGVGGTDSSEGVAIFGSGVGFFGGDGLLFAGR